MAAFAAALAFFVVNQIMVGAAVAMLTGTTLRSQLREDGAFQLGTSGVLACLAPLVVVVVQFSLVLAPLLVLPLLAVRSSARMAVRRQHDALHDALTGLPTGPCSATSWSAGSRTGPCTAGRPAWPCSCSTSTGSRR